MNPSQLTVQALGNKFMILLVGAIAIVSCFTHCRQAKGDLMIIHDTAWVNPSRCYLVLNYNSDHGSGTFQMYVIDTAAYRYLDIAGKPRELIMMADSPMAEKHWTVIQDIKH